ncbi:MAG: 30S ribosomal protein S20 [Patescibacteria group bacterium]|nr:30S ribosomal protein S20 [Patescibacteria group bacterium]MCL5224106.1 30S ribosomal protein S20 [Patescibacteria group bacterium]
MPRTKTAKKEARKNARRRAKNNARKDSLRKAIRDYEHALAKGAAADIVIVYKALDKAAKAKIIEPNKASRLKSKLAKRSQKGGR